MNKIKAAEFVIALADFLAAITPTIKRTGPGIELFANAADDTAAEPTRYATLRHYDGEPATRHGRKHLAVQCEVIGRKSSTQSAGVVAQAFAEVLHDRLQDAHGPLMRQTLAGFNLLAITNLRPPKLVGGEVDQRQRAVFNFDVYYLPTGG